MKSKYRMDKIILGLAILLCSNLLVSSLWLQTQAIVLGIYTNTTILTFVSIIGGMLLWASIRWIISNRKTEQDDQEQW